MFGNILIFGNIKKQGYLCNEIFETHPKRLAMMTWLSSSGLKTFDILSVLKFRRYFLLNWLKLILLIMSIYFLTQPIWGKCFFYLQEKKLLSEKSFKNFCIFVWRFAHQTPNWRKCKLLGSCIDTRKTFQTRKVSPYRPWTSSQSTKLSG